MQHVRLIIHGVVQGVFFRKHTREQARQYGITGFVMNLPDGTVYIEASGPVDSIAAFIRWCHAGPEGARVTSVDMEHIPEQLHSSFVIRY